MWIPFKYVGFVHDVTICSVHGGFTWLPATERIISLVVFY
jgi:hypothetical protein